MVTAKKPNTAEKRVMAARETLRRAIDRACIARGEAQWMNGYRAGILKHDAAQSDALYDKEVRKFKHCGDVERSVGRAIANYARLIRLSERKR